MDTNTTLNALVLDVGGGVIGFEGLEMCTLYFTGLQNSSPVRVGRLLSLSGLFFPRGREM